MQADETVRCGTGILVIERHVTGKNEFELRLIGITPEWKPCFELLETLNGIKNPEGLDIPELINHVAKTGSVIDFPGTDPMSNEELLAEKCDVLIPAALGGVLTKDNAESVRAKMIIEAANGPTEPDADWYFRKREILVVPDILANAGGVTVSYFEWVQNIQQFSWTAGKINDELEAIMIKAYRQVRYLAKTKSLPMRTAAFLLGISRVGKVTTMRGI